MLIKDLKVDNLYKDILGVAGYETAEEVIEDPSRLTELLEGRNSEVTEVLRVLDSAGFCRVFCPEERFLTLALGRTTEKPLTEWSAQKLAVIARKTQLMEQQYGDSSLQGALEWYLRAHPMTPDQKQVLRFAMMNLWRCSANELKIVKLWFGFDEEPLGIEQIAKRLEIPWGEVVRLYHKALHDFRKAYGEQSEVMFLTPRLELLKKIGVVG